MRRLTLVILLFLIFLTIPIVSCSIKQSDVFFPTMIDPHSPVPELGARGWLVFEDGCLRVKPIYIFGKSYLIIWPYGYSFEVKGREVRVLDGEGEVVARSGHWMHYGGGPVEEMEIVEKYHGQSIPEDKYPGPYWLFGGVVD